MLRHLLGADFKWRMHLRQAADVQALGAQLRRQLTRMSDQLGIGRAASRRIQ